MKKTLFLAALLLVVFSGVSSARVRGKGFQTNYGVMNQGLILFGFQASKGYMFDDYQYLGVGASMTSFGLKPKSSFSYNGEIFLQYRALISSKDSTPTIGLKAGIGSPDLYYNGIMNSIDLGWYWERKSGKGLAISVGMPFGFKEWKFGAIEFLPNICLSTCF